jgi:hypothetical protein
MSFCLVSSLQVGLLGVLTSAFMCAYLVTCLFVPHSAIASTHHFRLLSCLAVRQLMSCLVCQQFLSCCLFICNLSCLHVDVRCPAYNVFLLPSLLIYSFVIFHLPNHTLRYIGTVYLIHPGTNRSGLL